MSRIYKGVSLRTVTVRLGFRNFSKKPPKMSTNIFYSWKGFKSILKENVDFDRECNGAWIETKNRFRGFIALSGSFIIIKV